MKPNQALAQLKQSIEEHSLSEWTAGLDSAVRRFGVCNLTKKHISLSRTLCELNSDEEVTDTILHEIAHALAYERHGKNCKHDKRWQKICIEIGARPEACFDDAVVQPEAPWLLVHKATNEVFSSYFKRPNRDWSQVWIRGRKEDTQGQLVIKSRKSMSDNTTMTSPEKVSTPKDSNDTTLPEANSVEPVLSFTEKTVLQVHQDLVAMIKTYAKQHNLDLGGVKCKYSSMSCDFTMSLSVPSSIDATEMERIEFNALASLFDLTSDDYQREFQVNGRRFSLIALKPNNRKYPIIGADESGRQYKFTVDVIDQFENA